MRLAVVVEHDFLDNQPGCSEGRFALIYSVDESLKGRTQMFSPGDFSSKAMKQLAASKMLAASCFIDCVFLKSE